MRLREFVIFRTFLRRFRAWTCRILYLQHRQGGDEHGRSNSPAAQTPHRQMAAQGSAPIHHEAAAETGCKVCGKMCARIPPVLCRCIGNPIRLACCLCCSAGCDGEKWPNNVGRDHGCDCYPSAVRNVPPVGAAAYAGASGHGTQASTRARKAGAPAIFQRINAPDGHRGLPGANGCRNASRLGGNGYHDAFCAGDGASHADAVQ